MEGGGGDPTVLTVVHTVSFARENLSLDGIIVSDVDQSLKTLCSFYFFSPNCGLKLLNKALRISSLSSIFILSYITLDARIPFRC